MKLKIVLLLLMSSSLFAHAQEPKLTEDWSKKPPVIKPGKWCQPPSDAIVLYRHKKDLDNWQLQNGMPASWKVGLCGLTANRTGSIITKQAFGDCQLHIEWHSPRKIVGSGQGRGNSGIYFMGLYEVQVLDSYENETYYNGQAGAIYKQNAPLVNASRKPGRWQAYDIIFHAPHFDDDGNLVKAASLSVIHNGVLIQDHFILKGPTVYGGYPKYVVHKPMLPLLLQDHGNPVQYRNIWIRPL